MATYNVETKIWEGPKVPYNFPNETSLGAEVLKKLSETPERVFQISHHDGFSLTCHQARLNSIRIAQNLTKLGFGKGDVFGFLCDNGKNFPVTLFASLLIGAPVNPIDPRFKKDEIKNMFGQTVPKLVFCEAGAFETTKAALTELDNSAMIVTFGDKIGGATYIEDLLAPTGNEDSFEPPSFGDTTKLLALILSSSGTTGTSKGVSLSHHHVLSYVNTANQSDSYRFLSFSPTYWASGITSPIVAACRSRDTKIVTTDPFNVDLLVHLIKKYDVNYCHVAPHQLNLLLRSPELDPRDFIGVQVINVMGGVVSQNLRNEFQATFPRHGLIIGYGMSETCISIGLTDPNNYNDGLTAGRIASNILLKVIDDQGQNQEIGRSGEVLVRTQFPFMGYYNNDEASKAAVDSEGFLITGDIGYVDENGQLFIIDRKKEIMKYNSHQVNPSEIENIIESIEGVELVSVVGIPHPVSTNLPAAVIVKRPDFEDLTEQFIMDYVAEKLPEYKHLHGGVHFVDELPMTATGKIQKRFVKVIAMKEFNEKLAFENGLNQ